MTRPLDIEGLLASGFLEPERARELLGLPPGLAHRLEELLAARTAAHAPDMRAARERLLARLAPPPALSWYLEQQGLSLWSRAAAGLHRFVADTERMADELRSRLFAAALAPAAASLAPPPETPSVELVIYPWAGREPPRDTSCRARIHWLGDGAVRVDAWIPPAESAAYPGLGRGYALLRVGGPRGAPLLREHPTSGETRSSTPRRTSRGAAFPFPIQAAEHELDGSGLRLSILLAAPAPPRALADVADGIQLAPSQVALILFEARAE